MIGAQVLAASLRDGGTTKKLAVIVPADEAHRLLPQTIAQLEVYLSLNLVTNRFCIGIIRLCHLNADSCHFKLFESTDARST